MRNGLGPASLAHWMLREREDSSRDVVKSQQVEPDRRHVERDPDALIEAEDIVTMARKASTARWCRGRRAFWKETGAASPRATAPAVADVGEHDHAPGPNGADERYAGDVDEHLLGMSSSAPRRKQR